jgi:hypothetical protein
MRRVWWIVRIAVIVAASYCIFVPGGAYSLSKVQAEEEGGKCNTNTTCARDSNNNCYCPDATIGGPGCTGCFVPNGSPGCGSCSAGPAGLD